MTSPEAEKKQQRLQVLEDHIGRSLAESQRSGELRGAPSWGKPLAEAAGYAQTPDELKLPFKMLKDAGFVPPEVEWMQSISRLQAEHDALPPGAEAARPLAQKIAELRQQLAMRLEKLRASGTL